MNINIDYDTKTKKMALKIDGKVIKNAEDVHLFSYNVSEDEVKHFLDISMRDNNYDEEGYWKTTKIMASEDGCVEETESENSLRKNVAKCLGYIE